MKSLSMTGILLALFSALSAITGRWLYQMAAKRACHVVIPRVANLLHSMLYYLNIILAIADARYQEAYWDQVHRSELWFAALVELIKDD